MLKLPHSIPTECQVVFTSSTATAVNLQNNHRFRVLMFKLTEVHLKHLIQSLHMCTVYFLFQEPVPCVSCKWGQSFLTVIDYLSSAFIQMSIPEALHLRWLKEGLIFCWIHLSGSPFIPWKQWNRLVSALTLLKIQCLFFFHVFTVNISLLFIWLLNFNVSTLSTETANDKIVNLGIKHIWRFVPDITGHSKSRLQHELH